jgi:hypothetical protein
MTLSWTLLNQVSVSFKKFELLEMENFSQIQAVFFVCQHENGVEQTELN